uniref:Slc24a-5 n=1 Tax=Schmidtea mediterranea TaxID=79327 RepID=A0A0H3YF40_SCHMD|nr:slc24a-5 [Schmidtea mediterranea]
MESCNPKNKTFNESFCNYVINRGSCSFDSGFINYFQWQFCGFDNRIIPTILMFLWFLVLLLAVAVTADSFFAPCLVVVTKILRMSQNLAGVTLLALGNGAADVFSSLSAVISTSSPNVSLALGSILGAGILVNTVTAGIIMIIVPFDVMRRPIIKDLIFYLLALLWCMFILIRRQIELWSSVVFLIIYVIYVTVTGVSRAIYVKQKRGKLTTQEDTQHKKDESGSNIQYSRENRAYINDVEPCNSLNSLPSSLQSPNSLTNSNQDSERNHLSLIPMQSFRSKRIPSIRNRTMGSIAKIIIENEYHKEILEAKKNMNRKRSLSLDLATEKPKFNNRKRFISLDQENLKEIKKTEKENRKIKEFQSPAPKINIISEENQIEKSSVDSTLHTSSESDIDVETKDVQFPGLFKHFLMKIIPINFEEWKEQSLFSKVLSVIQSPIMFILTLTIPVVEEEEYLKGWCKLLNCLHCILSPLIWITFIKFSAVPLGSQGFILIHLVLIIGVCAAISAAITSKANAPPEYYSLFAFVGFLTSIFWIYAIANEIVNILETFGVVLSIPQTILGLTILAFANSIGDLVSNIMLARKKFPRIAYAACIGGPLFNLLVGIGLPFSIANARYGKIKVELKSETIVLISTILLITIMNLIYLPVMRFRLRPVYGIIMIVIYVLFLLFVLLFATNVIKVTL